MINLGACSDLPRWSEASFKGTCWYDSKVMILIIWCDDADGGGYKDDGNCCNGGDGHDSDDGISLWEIIEIVHRGCDKIRQDKIRWNKIR